MQPPERAPQDHLTRLEILVNGDIEVQGRLPWSSNGTFLVDVCHDGRSTKAVYKPERGERPLWDYPSGLFRREVAAYIVSEALGWGLVPETVVRDGPLGPGSLQYFVEADLTEHYFPLVERVAYHDALRDICLFDIIINNGDRKSGHCLLSADSRVMAIDHGLCLHEEPKLRTVIWDFAGQPIPTDRVAAAARLAADPPAELRELLSDRELDALARRSAVVVRQPIFPRLHWGRAFPWPLV